MNIIQARNAAAQMTDDEKLLLSQAEQGIALGDVDRDALKSMHDKAYVRIAPYSHPQAANSISGLILTEFGRKVVQALSEFKPDERVELTAVAQELAVEAEAEQTEELETPKNFDERAAERDPDVTWHQGRKEQKTRSEKKQVETPAKDILKKKG